jgi:hypothetical protein
MDDRPHMQFFGRDSWESICHIEAHLVPEYRQSTGTRAVILGEAVGPNMAKKIKVLTHDRYSTCGNRRSTPLHQKAVGSRHE